MMAQGRSNHQTRKASSLDRHPDWQTNGTLYNTKQIPPKQEAPLTSWWADASDFKAAQAEAQKRMNCQATAKAPKPNEESL
jgi:hypothetical protein